MQVGDIVVLSASGKKLRCLRFTVNSIGEVVEIKRGNGRLPYVVKWLFPASSPGRLATTTYNRRDLKHFLGPTERAELRHNSN